MTPDQVRAAFEKRLALLTPALPTAWPNVAFTPPADGSAYQRCWLLPFMPLGIDTAQTTYRETGQFQINLYYPIGVGAAVAGARAALLRDWFPAGLVLAGAVRVQDRPTIVPALDDPNRYIIPVTVPYSIIVK